MVQTKFFYMKVHYIALLLFIYFEINKITSNLIIYIILGELEILQQLPYSRTEQHAPHLWKINSDNL